jgi:hypothetical protein
MRKTLLLVGLLLVAASSFADTTYNNYIGLNPFWHPFGNPNTATYGELFTAPSAPDTNLASFGFWMAAPDSPGDIILGGYIATWTGTNAGTLLYSSSSVDYPNVGEAEIKFNTGGLAVTPGQQYVMFLSVSQYYGQSAGLAQVDAGSSIPGLNGFAYYNNSGDFNSLFTNPWDAQGISPDWAVELNFTGGNGVPEPGTLMMLGTGLLGGLGVLRRKLF